MALDAIDQNIWTISRPHRMMGLPVGVRMTVIRLPSGELFLHSPIELTPEIRQTLDDLGSVRYVICPNKMHHLFAGSYSAVYPSATFYVAPGLVEKRPDLSFAKELSPNPEPEWMDVLAQLRIEGVPWMEETVFFHRSSRSLIVTDLVFNLPPSKSLWAKAFMTLNGVEGRLACSRLFRSQIKDKEAFRASIERVLVWQPSRVIMSHGEVRHLRGIEELRQAFAGI